MLNLQKYPSPPAFHMCCGMQRICTDSRPAPNNTRRRRYKCTLCDSRTTTYEYADDHPTIIAPNEVALLNEIRALSTPRREALRLLLSPREVATAPSPEEPLPATDLFSAEPPK